MANSRNNRVTTKKYMSTSIASALLFLSRGFGKVFYCDQKPLTAINTSIDTFFSKLPAVLAERKEGRLVMVNP